MTLEPNNADPRPSSAGGVATPSLGLAELIALNDELGALVRAGVPLEQTLGDMGRDFPGRLGRATSELADRMANGESLPAAIAAMPQAFSPVYRAAVEAGLRAGRLPAVLEELASSARRQLELRQTIWHAMVYPLFVVLLTYGCFMFLIIAGLPRFTLVFEREVPRGLQLLIKLGESASTWAAIPPIVLILAFTYAMWRMNRVGRSFLDWLPMIGPMLSDFHRASFCENLGLLIGHDVPLPQALCLAGDGSADRRLSQGAHALATRLAAGERAADPDDMAHADLPRLVLWMITSEQPKSSLVAALERAAASYRRQALRRSDRLRYYLPVMATLAFGGVAAMLFALTLFAPMVELLLRLASVEAR